jgi:catechol 2,3-dioxygenase-like lactoylglutathione lyase family enzyme
MIHHLAIATKNIAEAHHFYTEVMGFELVKAVKRKAPGGGWTKHIFYDQGDGALFALWDLRGLESAGLAPDAWRSGLSSGMGLPNWVNHIAFEALNAEDFDRRKQRWLDHGYHVSVVDHDFIRSAYTIDPDGTMVEWAYRTALLTADDRTEAEGILADDSPATEEDYDGIFIRATVKKSRPTTAQVPSFELA